MKERFIIFAKVRDNHLDIYLRELSGREHFLMVRRFSPALFGYLRNGRTLREARSFHPGRGRGETAVCEALRRVVRVADWVLAEEAADADAVALAG